MGYPEDEAVDESLDFEDIDEDDEDKPRTLH